MSNKRSNGEGNVRKLPSGSWRGQVMDDYTEEGKRNIKSFTAPTRREVLMKISDYKAKQQYYPDATPKIVLFQDFADYWYASYKMQVEESTYSNYFYTLKLLKSHKKLTTTKSSILLYLYVVRRFFIALTMVFYIYLSAETSFLFLWL